MIEPYIIIPLLHPIYTLGYLGILSQLCKIDRLIITLPPLHLPSPIRPIQPTPMIHPQRIRIITRLHSQLRRLLRPHTRLAIKHNLPLLPFCSFCSCGSFSGRFRVSESGLEFLRRQEIGIRLRSQGDRDGARNDARCGEFGRFADID